MAIASVIFDIRAGVAKLNQDFARAEKTVQKGMAKVQDVMKKATIGLAAYMGLRSVGAFASSVIQLGDDLDKLSQRTGVSAEALQALRYGAEQNGASVDNLQRALRNLSERIGEVGSGIDRFEARYARFGIALKDANGQVRSTEDVLMDVADVLASMPDGAAKTEAAMKLLGVNAGPRLLPMLNSGSEGLKAFREEAEAMGIVLSSDAVQALSNVSTNITRLKSILKGVGQNIMAGLAAPLEALTERLFEVGTGTEKYAAIQRGAATVARGFLEAIDTMTGMLHGLFLQIVQGIPSIGSIGDAIKGVVWVFKEFDVVLHSVALALRVVSTAGELVGRIFETVGKVVAAAVSAALNAVQGRFREAHAAFKELGRDLLDDAGKTWDRLKHAWTASSEEIVGAARKAGLGVSEALGRIEARGASASKALASFPPAAKEAAKAAADSAKEMERLAKALRDNALETEIIVAESMGQTVQVMRLRLQQEINAIQDMLEAGQLTQEDFARRREALERKTEQEITKHYREERKKREREQERALEKAKKEQEEAQQVGLAIGESITHGFRSAFEADSFRDVIRSILGIFSRVASLIPGGQLAGGVSSIFAGLFAKGGLVRGPGTDTSDNLVALLSPGEFVNTAQAVRRFGAEFFERLNQGVIDLSVLPRYAAGGLVGEPAPAPVVPPAVGQAPTVYIQAFDPQSTQEALARVWEPAQYRRGMSRQDARVAAMLRRRISQPRSGR